MNFEPAIIDWLKEDAVRMDALQKASALKLNDWCLAAGFVRNLVWDRLHGYTEPTPLNDIDLIYFDADSIDEAVDQDYEVHLKSISSYPWSVKNQARMHVRNGDAPYLSVMDAMSYWVEVETAVGARMSGDGEIQLVAPFGCQSLFDKTITLNKKRPKLQDFEARISSKNWLKVWPGLSVRV